MPRHGGSHPWSSRVHGRYRSRTGHSSTAPKVQPSSPETIVIVGGPGTGKSHLGVALAIQAVKTNRRVRFFSVVDLVNRLEKEKAAAKQGRLAQRLTLMCPARNQT